jgi:hypothetical protein
MIGRTLRLTSSKNDSQRQFVTTEIIDLLLDTVICEFEIVFLQIADDAPGFLVDDLGVEDRRLVSTLMTSTGSFSWARVDEKADKARTTHKMSRVISGSMGVGRRVIVFVPYLSESTSIECRARPSGRTRTSLHFQLKTSLGLLPSPTVGLLTLSFRRCGGHDRDSRTAFAKPSHALQIWRWDLSAPRRTMHMTPPRGGSPRDEQNVEPADDAAPQITTTRHWRHITAGFARDVILNSFPGVFGNLVLPVRANHEERQQDGKTAIATAAMAALSNRFACPSRRACQSQV